MPGHVVVAPDKFKGSLGAAGVALAVADGLRAAVPGLDAREHPVADGGDGTVEAALSAGFARKEVPCTGPTGAGITAALAVRDQTAVVELAEASGLRRLPGGRLAPMSATSRGTGELIRAALDLGCRQVVVGIGGSACTDGGAGMVQALGGRLLDAAGAELAPGGGPLADLDRLDLAGFDPRVAGTEFVVASDVRNPLLGPRGAAAVYGPQKGASASEVALLDAALARWAAVARAATGIDGTEVPGGGAAGGVGFAAAVFLGAELRSGIEYLLDLLEVRAALPGARLVVTGEGSLDEQTLHGKAPAGVAAAARAAGVPTVVAVAGRNTLPAAALSSAGIARAYALSDLEADPERSMREPVPLLRRLAGRIAADWLGGGP
jgi:glycerate 2-kinase